MLIDSSHPVVESLVTEWKSAELTPREERPEPSVKLRKKLVSEMNSLIEPFAGQLMLLYHKFLAMVPSGVHSFAHGSEMVSEVIYDVKAARLSVPASLAMHESPGSKSEGEWKIRFCPSTTFLVSVEWQWSLYPIYPTNSFQPSFVLDKPRQAMQGWRLRKTAETNLPEPGPLDISCFGGSIFRARKGKHDWATEVYLVLGTSAVKEWLDQHHSSQVFHSLEELKELVY